MRNACHPTTLLNRTKVAGCLTHSFTPHSPTPTSTQRAQNSSRECGPLVQQKAAADTLCPGATATYQTHLTPSHSQHWTAPPAPQPEQRPARTNTHARPSGVNDAEARPTAVTGHGGGSPLDSSDQLQDPGHSTHNSCMLPQSGCKLCKLINQRYTQVQHTLACLHNPDTPQRHQLTQQSAAAGVYLLGAGRALRPRVVSVRVLRVRARLGMGLELTNWVAVGFTSSLLCTQPARPSKPPAAAQQDSMTWAIEKQACAPAIHAAHDPSATPGTIFWTQLCNHTNNPHRPPCSKPTSCLCLPADLLYQLCAPATTNTRPKPLRDSSLATALDTLPKRSSRITLLPRPMRFRAAICRAVTCKKRNACQHRVAQTRKRTCTQPPQHPAAAGH